MTDAEQVVTQLRNEAQQFFDRVYDVKRRLSISGNKSTKWFNHGIADVETGLSKIEKACLQSDKATKKRQLSQQQPQPQSQSQTQSYRGSGNNS